jgi:hypothetical protein
MTKLPSLPLTRRGFIRATSMAAIGGVITAADAESVFAQSPPKTRVVLIRDRSVLDNGGRMRADIVQSMLDTAVTTLTGAKDAAAAWRAIVRPDDVVGIKSNGWSYLPTPPELEAAIQRRLVETGVARADIAVDDQGIRTNPVFRRSTALINTRPMRTHHWAGVGSLIKNYIMFVPDPPSYHPDSCADIATIWNLPNVKGKTRLNVLVLLTPQFHGVGPHSYSPQYVWKYFGLAVGIDPVAVDSVGLRIIEAKRREHFQDNRPLNPPAKHIALADTRHHLGTADPAKIELVKLGDTDGALI